ncbi:MAG: hypothetical protein IPK03_02955 [Bacteroidetes bacterium]|nr:hypothetical protein [Bacteroidota bacterium]
MKKNIIYAILFLCLIENKSYGQVTFIKEYSSPNGDRIKSNGIYQTNVANELAMTISNYDEGNTSILLLTRNGNIKNKATLKFKYDYAYISNLFFVQDTIYGCGNSTPVMQEATCSGSKPTGFYFKYVLNRSNPNNITGTFAWIKEDELLNSGEASVYYKIDAIRNDSLYMIGVLYQNHGGCTGSSKSAIVMINAKDGSKYSSNVSQSNSTVNFISKVDLLADRNSVFTTDQDWTDIFGSTHRYYNVLRKLNSSNLNIQDSIHFRGIGTGGNTLERHSFFFNSLFSEGSNDGSPNLITAYAAGMTQGLDSVIAICKISKSTLNVVQQSTFKLGENQLILSGQLMPKSNGYLMFVSTKPDKFATIPNLVRLIELDNNLNLINAYELTANLFSNHSTGAYAINNVVLIGNDLFLYTNKSNKIQLNRLDLSDTSSTCQKIE